MSKHEVLGCCMAVSGLSDQISDAVETDSEEESAQQSLPSEGSTSGGDMTASENSEDDEYDYEDDPSETETGGTITESDTAVSSESSDSENDASESGDAGEDAKQPGEILYTSSRHNVSHISTMQLHRQRRNKKAKRKRSSASPVKAGVAGDKPAIKKRVESKQSSNAISQTETEMGDTLRLWRAVKAVIGATPSYDALSDFDMTSLLPVPRRLQQLFRTPQSPSAQLIEPFTYSAEPARIDTPLVQYPLDAVDSAFADACVRLRATGNIDSGALRATQLRIETQRTQILFGAVQHEEDIKTLLTSLGHANQTARSLQDGKKWLRNCLTQVMTKYEKEQERLAALTDTWRRAEKRELYARQSRKSAKERLGVMSQDLATLKRTCKEQEVLLGVKDEKIAELQQVVARIKDDIIVTYRGQVLP